MGKIVISSNVTLDGMVQDQQQARHVAWIEIERRFEGLDHLRSITGYVSLCQPEVHVRVLWETF